jgi:rhamnose transport system ATP-binding protein
MTSVQVSAGGSLARSVPRLAVRNISKSFGAIAALRDVSFDVTHASVHAVVGANGAGKSTLIKVLSGFHAPDRGTVAVDGDAVAIARPADAFAAGIVTIYQESHLCPDLTIAENIALGQMGSAAHLLRASDLDAMARPLLDAVGLAVDPRRLVAALSIGQRQMVEICRGLSHRARVMIFDEPTASLTQGEARVLFSVIAELKRQGVSVLYISHRMPEIFEICDTVTVLRDGAHVWTRDLEELQVDDIISAMIGEGCPQERPSVARGGRGDAVLGVERLSGPGFCDVSLSLKRGEVFGLYGLVGSGRTELALAISGASQPDSGAIRYRGEVVIFANPGAALASGIALVPEDRKRNGLILDMDLRGNISLPHLSRSLSRLGFVNDGAVDRLSARLMDRLRVKAPHARVPATALSGGNQQKVVFAKAIAGSCEVLIVDEPTQGVDVAGKEEIYRILAEMTAAGTAVLMITSDLPELLRMSDRVMVLYEGRVMGELTREAADEESVMRLASGKPLQVTEEAA